ncbi:MAG: 3-phosphoserine/phosphohydroxythreonine transaminase [Clostridia bacterium]|nr:3-phosphoserine/phosphohydroxythreonine transaminase [Clostridia bacterium]
MSNRVYNFAAGPAVMPEPVLLQAAQELFCHGDDGMSVMEMSHRSAMYEKIIFGAEEDLRRLMNIPSNYKVLFLQGGASLQFYMAPLNLYRKSFSADYIDTGSWTQKGMVEAKKIGNVRIVASSKADNFTYIPSFTQDMLDPEADFLYIVTNNTIYGTRYTAIPDSLPGVPLVGDASSNILSEEIDINKFGVLFFGAQKNVGPAGLTVVIIREDLLGFCPETAPTMLNYSVMAKNDSMFNTPPTYAIYMAGLVFRWMLENGGVPAMEKVNNEKAAMLYDCIDRCSLYTGTVRPCDRSLMNATFVLPTEELNNKFVAEAAERGLVNLKGHRSVGGIRASIYNAMPVAGVQALVNFMEEFDRANR